MAEQNNEVDSVGYDARNIYPAQVVLRLHKYLDCDVDNVQKRLDLLGDFIDVGSIYVKDKDKIRESLEYIDSLLNPDQELRKKAKKELANMNRECSDINAKALLKRKAKRLITENYDKVFKAYDNVNLFVPKINKLDPNRAFANYN